MLHSGFDNNLDKIINSFGVRFSPNLPRIQKIEHGVVATLNLRFLVVVPCLPWIWTIQMRALGVPVAMSRAQCRSRGGGLSGGFRLIENGLGLFHCRLAVAVELPLQP